MAKGHIIDLCVLVSVFVLSGSVDEEKITRGDVSRRQDGSTTVRLVDGHVDTEGRVEVYYGGRWGTICDDWWDDLDAAVVCRQLGFHGGEARLLGHYGPGSGPIHLDTVQCLGTEAQLEDCAHRDWGTHDCSHAEDAGVRCDRDQTSTESITKVRLVDGTTPYEGRVEVLHDGYWGAICDDGWDEDNAEVICRSLGYGPGEALQEAVFGEGSGQIWMDDVSCGGYEDSVELCGHNGWGVHNCAHSEDAGVRCDPIFENFQTIRLVDGASYNDGRVEILHDGRWGTVCDDSWDDTDASVVCRSLGFISGQARTNGEYGAGEWTTWMDDVSCTGTESRLEECGHNGWGVHNCDHFANAGVVCDTIDPTFEPVRLLNGNSPNEGRVEIYHDDEWGAVCDDRWDDDEAAVVCHSLGYVTGHAVDGYYYGTNQQRVWLDNMDCSGSEAQLSACAHSGWGVHDCENYEDAAARCESGESQLESEGLILPA